MDAPTSERNENLEQLHLKLKDYEDEIAKLQQEKSEMKTDFDNKRTKIKDLYFAKENAIRELNSKLFEAGSKISELESLVTSLREEIENVKMIASVSENTKEEAVEDLNKHHQEEIESLRCVLQDSMEEQRNDLISQFEQERRRWEEEKLALEKECKDSKSSLANLKIPSSPKKEEAQLENDQLGLTMEAAQSEAEALKAVVVPLEAEIAELKSKLAECEISLMKERQDMPRNDKDNGIGSHFLRRKNSTDDSEYYCQVEENSEQDSSKTDLSISLETSSHNDLVDYVDALTKQKLILQKENDTLKIEMHEVCRSLEQEISKTTELQKTDKESNKQLQNLQLEQSKTMDLIQQAVTHEQWKMIEETIYYQTMQQTTQQNQDTENSSQIVSDSNLKEDFQPFQSHHSTKHNLLSSTSALDNISVSSLPSRSESAIREASSPQKVFSAPDLQALEYKNNSKSSKILPSIAWDEIPSEASGPDARNVKPCDAVNEYAHVIESLTNERSKLKEELLVQQSLLAAEKQKRTELESEFASLSEQVQNRSQDLSDQLSRLENKLDEDRSWRKMKETEDDKRLNALQKDREHIFMNYLKLKKENDNVKTFYEKYRIDLSKQPIVSMDVEELQLQIHQLRESLLAAQVERNHIESVLQSKLSFAQSSLTAEQVAKEQLESTLSADVESSRKQIHSLQNSVSKLEREVRSKKDLEVELDKSQTAYETLRLKSKEIINDLKEKLKAETQAKKEVEESLQATRNQVRSLQDALETSEHVQKDFVRLSQSLQMQLEEIRSREEENDTLTDQNDSSSESNLNTKPG